MRKQRDTTEERHEQDMRELRGQQHGHVADVHRMRGCAVSWTLRQPRTRMIRQGHKQTHEAALRASRYTRRHAWQFHGAGVEAAARELTALSGVNTVPAVRDALDKLAVSLNVPGPLVLDYDDTPLIPETREPAVGWWSPSRMLLCLKHSQRGATPVTAENLPEGGCCAVCGFELTP